MDLLDTRRAVETPEGINLDLRLAGPVVRSLAWAIDSAIRYTVLLLGAMLLSLLGVGGIGMTLIVYFLLEWFYPVAFELYRDGATPGKQMLGIKVVSDNGAPVAAAASMIRNLLRAADFLPLMYGFGLICMMLNQDSKRLGDLAAGTVVIYRDRTLEQTPLPAGPAYAPSQPLAPAEQRLLINFAERAGRLNPERQHELAELLATMAPATGGSAVETLLANARWLRGQRA